MLGLGCSFSNHRACGSGSWIWWYRRGISGYRETPVRYIPCSVHKLFDFPVAPQTRAVSCNGFRVPLAGREQSTRRGEDWVACVLCFLT